MYCSICRWSSPYGCDIPAGAVCPAEADKERATREVVVPCPKCGRDCDGNGVIDGIPVCSHCDRGVL